MEQTASEERRIIVPPLDARRETLGVLVAIAVIIALMALRFSLTSDTEQFKYMRPYQRLDSILDTEQRTVYQSLLAIVPEVEYLRDEEGDWPEAELLEMDGLPPFDVNLLPPALRGVVWTGHNNNSWIDYVGRDQTGDLGATLLLRLIDLHAEYHPHPHPGIDYDPNMKVAVQIWMYPETNRPYPGERLPEAGWWWVVAPDDKTLTTPPQPTPTPTPTPAPTGENT